ncbi:hypothetical protein H312_03571 [Anncaliia algerae PRA339]|uniref:Uncharacterized protein n=1 Tax=Anncaliia algerae PRA339 TaxID=1288291 RepID=A0A059EWF2_9MICR|nr:hypothetical protein H312_03571 [Anncaliia algerae PRA339]
MVEFEDKTRLVFAVVIPDKWAATILPIICESVIYGSVI